MGNSDGNKICGEAVNSKIEDLSPKEITLSVSESTVSKRSFWNNLTGLHVRLLSRCI